MIAAVLAHPQGGAKDVPPTARLIPFLNKAEDEATLAAAREIARLLLQQPRIDSVLIGAAQGDDPVREVWGRSGAVVLAAGEAKRFGALKQVLPWRGVPLVAHVADQALRCPDMDRVAVTVGAGAEQVRAALAGRDVSVVPVAGLAARTKQKRQGRVAGSRSTLPAPRSTLRRPLPPGRPTGRLPGTALGAHPAPPRDAGADRRAAPRRTTGQSRSCSTRPPSRSSINWKGTSARGPSSRRTGTRSRGWTGRRRRSCRISMLLRITSHPPRVRRMKTGLRGLGVVVSLW